MNERYLSKLKPDQLLYTDTDSVVVYRNKKNPSHVQLRTSDMLGELKDEYDNVLSSNSNWFVSEFIAFGPKMYQLLFKDKLTGQIVKWDKTMKGISMKGTTNLVLPKNLHLYRNPVLDFCSILQYGPGNKFLDLDEVRVKMIELHKARRHLGQKSSLTVNITFNKSLFKRRLSQVFTNQFVMSMPIKKQAHVTQSKQFPRPDINGEFGVTFPIGWR